MTDSEKHFRRLNYCGTCRTIGSIYGNKSRLLLNYDTVFLAEILTAVSDENVQDWQKSYQSFNCLNLPKNEMPLSMQFAATTNIILTEFKLADHFMDEGKRRYQFARKAFSKEFQKAEFLLKKWNFPLNEVKAILQTQAVRESEIGEIKWDENLAKFAEPTAAVTGIFFREGVKQIGKNQPLDLVYSIGFNFGKLIYLLDAFEDYEKDARTNQFNALRAAFNLKENGISRDAKRKIVSILRELESKIAVEIYALPIAENQKSIFASRISGNLQRKLKMNLPVVQTRKVCSPKPKQTFTNRWQTAKATAKNLTRSFSWQMPLVFLFVFAFAFVAPAQSREAKSARECFDLSFNLMFLGAFFGSVLAYPKNIWMENPESTKEQVKRDLGEGVGEGAAEGCCDACECCCCECDGCGCDNCDCCSGCCDNCGCDCSCD